MKLIEMETVQGANLAKMPTDEYRVTEILSTYSVEFELTIGDVTMKGEASGSPAHVKQVMDAMQKTFLGWVNEDLWEKP